MKRAQKIVLAACVALFLDAARAVADPVRASAHTGGGDQMGNLVRLLLAGPFVVLVLAACYALILLFSVLFDAEQRLGSFLDDAAERISPRRLALTVWGITTFVLVVALVAILSKVLAILAIAVAVFGLTLLGAGLAAACLQTGSRLSQSAETAGRFSSGLWLMIGASAVPLVGWVFAFIAVAAGIGAVLETAVARMRLPK